MLLPRRERLALFLLFRKEPYAFFTLSRSLGGSDMLPKRVICYQKEQFAPKKSNSIFFPNNFGHFLAIFFLKNCSFWEGMLIFGANRSFWEWFALFCFFALEVGATHSFLLFCSQGGSNPLFFLLFCSRGLSNQRAIALFASEVGATRSLLLFSKERIAFFALLLFCSLAKSKIVKAQPRFAPTSGATEQSGSGSPPPW